jgi:hypothetical protein
MANQKISDLTEQTNLSLIDGLAGYEGTSNVRISGPNIISAIPTIYSDDGTIGANRVATITDFPKFSGTQSNPIGLEIENTQGSGSSHSTQGAQLKLTAYAGASSTISFYNGLGGGSSAPAMIIDSPAGIRNIAGGTYSGYHHLFSGSTWNVGITNSPLNASSPRLDMLLGGGGSNGSFYTTKISGSNDFLYMWMSPGTAGRHIALGEYTNSTSTYKDFLRINSTGDIGINQDTPTAKLHVTGSGSTFATTSLLVENSNGDDLIQILDSGRFFIGKGASNANDNNIVYGNSASAQGSFNVALGNSASVQGGSYSIAIGASPTVASVSYGIGIGQSYIGGTEAIAIGHSSRAYIGGISIGHNAGTENQTGTNTISIGRQAKHASGVDNSIILNASGSTTAGAATTSNTLSVHMTSSSTPDFKVVGNEGMVPPSITTTTRDAIASPDTGSTIYNTTDNELQYYNGTSWVSASGGGGGLTPTTQTANYTASANDFVICNVTTSLRVTLPAASAGAIVGVKYASQNAASDVCDILTPSTGVTIDGTDRSSTALPLPSINTYYELISDGTNWFIK